jgi:two-component system, OmpR family, alkaline phosphatase synthesis response regulator PhoP
MTSRYDILIIDDDIDLVGVMQTVLESKAYQVRAARDGSEGFTKIREKAPDLIILDVMMATETEGFDLAFKLRNQPDYRDIPILMVTSFPQKMAEEGPEKFQHILGEQWPVSQFLEKPLDPEVFLNAVETLLRDAG